MPLSGSLLEVPEVSTAAVPHSLFLFLLWSVGNLAFAEISRKEANTLSPVWPGNSR